MQSLPPTPTLQPPPAPTISKAQPTRQVRTNRADEQESTSFETALQQAGDSNEQPDAAASILDEAVTPSDEPVDPVVSEAESAESAAADEPDPEVAAEVPIDSAEANPAAAALIGESIPRPVADPLTTASTSTPETSEQQAKGASVPAPKPIASGSPVTAPDAPQEPVLLPAEQQLEAAPANASTETQPAPAPQIETQTAAAETQAATANTTAPPAPQTVEPASAQVVSSDASVEIGSETGSGAETSQDDARQGAAQQRPDSAARVLDSTAAPQAPIEPIEAQPLRQPVAEAAPSVAEPVSIDPQPAPSGLSSQGVRPSAAPAAAQAPSLGTVEPDQAFTTAVQRGLAAAVRQQGGTLTIKLDPPSLGKLTIRMTIDQGRVEASFDANNAQARDLLIEHASTLRAQLRDKGLSVEKIEIVGASAAQAARASQPQSSNGDQPGSHSEHDESQHDSAGGQSRGRSETGEEQSSRNDGINGESARSADDPATSRFETELRYSVNAVA